VACGGLGDADGEASPGLRLAANLINIAWKSVTRGSGIADFRTWIIPPASRLPHLNGYHPPSTKSLCRQLST
jgi:hypothetical protein